MKRVLALLGLLLLGTIAPAAALGAQPNIVLIMADDQPMLDGRLMRSMPTAGPVFLEHGATFTDFHSESPLCCPARAGFLTGLYTHHHHVDENNAALLNPGETIATALRRAGYHTALAGKYLNRFKTVARKGKPPGWDRFAAFNDPSYVNYDLYLDGAAAPTHFGTGGGDYSTDVIARIAVQQIREAPLDRPLFQLVTPYGPHNPSTPAARHASSALCPNDRWLPPNFNEADVTDKPLYVRNQPALRAGKAKGWSTKGACQALLSVDELVRDVRSALAATGRLDDTLLIYSGDNGMMEGEHRFFDKQSPYSTQIPFYASWPAAWGDAPRSYGERLQNIDLAPTLCELAGCTLGPYPTGQPAPDGVSFAALLRGEGTTLPRDVVLDQMPNVKSAGTTPPPRWWAATTTLASPLAFAGCTLPGLCSWHYIEYETGEVELYDISGGPCWAWRTGALGDPCELTNRASDPALVAVRSDVAARLHALVQP